MKEDVVTLYKFERSYISITIEACFDTGKLVIEGYGIGERVSEVWGDSDYEYTTTVPEEEVVKLYPLMNVVDGDKKGLLTAIAEKYNTNTCYSEIRDFFEKNGIKSEGFSWT